MDNTNRTHPLVAEVRRLTEDLRLWELGAIVAGIVGLIIGAVLLS